MLANIVDLSSDDSDSRVGPTSHRIRRRALKRVDSDDENSAPKNHRVREEMTATPIELDSEDEAELVDATTRKREAETDDDEDEDDDDGFEIIESTQSAIDASLKHENKAKSLKDVTCPICLSEIDDAVVTPCGHLFCTDCLYQALPSSKGRNRDSGICPLCRKMVKLKDLTHLKIRVKVIT
ncbi:unnamed protein product [Kuraishia capsulata CBS 1993]|uniref:RING-type domain-containing protein n=1 Tax=Kuraishia capsulata CBS 1993 TaxID=1382522 RepID=W6MMK4_9ASCO|nr:uncharacterized protein KUCA_T00003808001 [Kuraishia capsulata CBS 1993]CDK27829.1 unnamed protein product [Kuraishia capsulata CBS 1993]